MVGKKLPAYPYEHKGVVLADSDLAVLRHDGLGHLCGYCAFSDVDIPEAMRGDYDAGGLQFLAVHGGITYADCTDGYSVFGFDCAHAGDDAKPELRDPKHVLELARQMREQIAALVAKYEEWLAADRGGRCAILDAIRSQATIETEVGFGGLISMLSGAPELGDRVDPKVSA